MDDLKETTRLKQVRMLYDGSDFSTIGSLIIIAVIYMTNTLENGGNPSENVWLLLVLLVGILRWMDSIQYFILHKGKSDDRHYLNRFATVSILSSLSWAILFWNIYPGSSVGYQAFMIITITGIASFGATILSYHLGISLSFILFLILPIQVKVVMESSEFLHAISLAMPLYLIILVNGAKRINRKYLENINLDIVSKEKEQQYINLQYAVDQHGIVSTTNVRGDIIYANKKLEEISKYTRDELIGENHRVVKSDEHSNEFWKDMWRTVSGGDVWHSEVKNIAKDGVPYWVDSTIIPFMDKHGKPYQYISIRTDITKLKELEQQHNRDKNDALVRAKVAQILQGPSSLKERVIEVLDELSNAEGMQIQNKLGVFLLPKGGDKLEMFVTHGEYTEQFLHSEKCVKLGSCLCGKVAVSGTLMISDDCMTDPLHEHSFDGMISHGHYIVPLWANGELHGIMFMYTDPFPSRDQSRIDTLNFIGDLIGMAIANESVKDELKQARKNAEETARTKSEFLANMSHEIRTPMNGVLGMLDLLNNIELDEKARSYVEIAHSSANMLLNVINDILDISKIESGKLHIETIDFDIRKTVEDTADLLSKQAHQKNLELSCFIPPDTKTHVQGDMMRLQQVLNNLISNAIKFTHKGEVIINIKVVEKNKEKERLRFEITDTGIGIPIDKQQSLFHAFTQVDASTSREFGGTGLGLTISRNLVEMMGGEMGIISESGKGSTFWFELPFDIAHEADENLSLETLRILTIDDNETNCLILKRYVESWGSTNETVTSPNEGVRLLKRAHDDGNDFDILLLDMQMPGKSGYEVAAEIRNNLHLHSLKIILLSSISLGLDTDENKLFDMMLNKPIRQSFLFDAITTIQNRRSNDVKKKTIIPELKVRKLLGRILFVDDNVVNQHVGREMLTTLGFKYKVVNNGQEAFEAHKNEQFDLILMDCQMPIMDGYEATREIRKYETSIDQDRVTVVALTANAMEGDREKCICAGMDDYLSKPYTSTSLFNTLANWLPESNETNKMATLEQGRDMPKKGVAKDTKISADSIDISKFEETREMMGGNMDVLVDAFVESGSQNLLDINAHYKDSDFDGLRESTHALKGSCGALGIKRLFDVCQQLENACTQGKPMDMDIMVKNIEQYFKESCVNIKTLMAEQLV